MSAAKRIQFHEKLLVGLKAKSFAQLSLLPASEEIKSPRVMNDWRFEVRRLNVGPGVLEMQVEARKDFGGGEYMASVKGFRMTSDGKITEEDLDVED